MKLKTKFEDEDFELGEVIEPTISTIDGGGIMLTAKANNGGKTTFHYKTLQELYDDFEDYKGEWPQVGDTYYAIHNNGTIHEHHWEQNQENQGRPVFNIFKTREEAKESFARWNSLVCLEKKGYKFDILNFYIEEENGKRKK